MATSCSNGTDREEQDICSELPDRCQQLEQVRCADGLDAVQTCEENATGCLVWTDSDCGPNQRCSEEDGDAVCVCQDTCTQAGATECVQEVIYTCSRDADECLVMETDTDCAAQGKTCDDGTEPAQCLTLCTNDCNAADETQCADTMLQRCSLAEDGCLYWEDDTNCEEVHMFCEDGHVEPASCVCRLAPPEWIHGTWSNEEEALTWNFTEYNAVSDNNGSVLDFIQLSRDEGWVVWDSGSYLLNYTNADGSPTCQVFFSDGTTEDTIRMIGWGCDDSGDVYFPYPVTLTRVP
jgi:hypothetical protein